MSVPRQEVGGAAIGDRVYVVGGVAAGESAPNAVVEAYDTIADSWSVMAPLPSPRRAVAAAAAGGILYVAGGFAAGDGAVADVFAYDPATDAWTARAPLPPPRGGAAAVAFGGKVYVAGGRRDGTALHDFAVYDPAADAWTAPPIMPHAREGLGLAATDLLIYAMGGRDGGPPITLGELFHPPSNEWFKEVAPLLTPRSRFGLAGLGRRVYAFGGDVPDGVVAGSGGAFPDVEMFDPTRNSWFRQPDLPTPRAGLAAVPVGARIYVVGGAVPGSDPTGATEIFLPESADALTVKKLALARRGKRLRLVATLPGATEDPAAVQLRVRVREGEIEVAAATLGSGALVAKGRSWRAAPGRLPAGAALSLRRRGEDLVLRFAGATLSRPTAPRGLSVVVELGPHILSGTLS